MSEAVYTPRHQRSRCPHNELRPPAREGLSAARLGVFVLPHLAALLLPEHGGLGVPLGLTGEGGHAALRHNLVPRSDHELGGRWRARGGREGVKG